jgi:hypothetical protein
MRRNHAVMARGGSSDLEPSAVAACDRLNLPANCRTVRACRPLAAPIKNVAPLRPL